MKQFFVSFRYFSFFILLLFPISYTQACYIPSTLKDKEVTSAECTSFGGSSGCVSGQVKIGTISGFLGGAGCGVDYNTYVNLINEGKLPQDESLPKPSSEITCTSQNGRCGPCNASESESGFCNTTEGSSVACCFPSLATPTSSATPSSFNYTPLETIPGTEGMDTSTLKGFLEGLFLFVMWSAGVASMFMIVIGGFWYMTSAGNTARVGEAKKIITNALLGLIVVLIAWLLLYVINPDLVKVDLSSLETIALDTGGFVGSYNKGLIDNPVTLGCGKIIESAYSMYDTGCKYSQPRRNGCKRTPAYTDCSDYTYNAYQMAGCKTGFGNTTLAMIGKTPLFNGDKTGLKAGDALVYNHNGSGHIVLCEQDGCSTVTHAAGTKAGLKRGQSSSWMFQKSSLHVIRAEEYCGDVLNSC